MEQDSMNISREYKVMMAYGILVLILLTQNHEEQRTTHPTHRATRDKKEIKNLEEQIIEIDTKDSRNNNTFT